MKTLFALFASALAQNALGVQPISPKAGADLFHQGKAVVIDVREKDELVESGMVEFAQWLAKSEIDQPTKRYQDFLKATPKEKAIVIYCRSGKRAQVAALHFEKLGYQAYNAGGFDAWAEAGLPVKKFSTP